MLYTFIIHAAISVTSAIRTPFLDHKSLQTLFERLRNVNQHIIIQLYVEKSYILYNIITNTISVNDQVQ